MHSLTHQLAAHAHTLSPLAQAWLAAGATSFGIWIDDRPLAHWPATPCPEQSGLTAPFRLGTAGGAELRVTGLVDSAAAVRLAADAELVENLVTLEDELHSMTAELSVTQDQLVAMFELAQLMRQHVTVEEVLRRLAVEAQRMTKAGGAFAVFVGATPTLVRHGALSVGETAIWQLFWQTHTTERELLLSGTSQAEQLPPAANNLFVVPLHIRGEVVAALGLINKPIPGFTAVDVRLARALAQQASAQVENVLLYQETLAQAKLQAEMDLARRVQLSLLPQQIPLVAGLDIYAYARPALQVSGDFYDFIYDPERPFIFSVGDVAGKGLSAALLMTMTRTAIHSKASFMPSPTPEAIMRHSTEDLYDDFSQVGVFATVLVGQYIPERDQLLIANAGHSPVIYRPAGGRAQLLRADDSAIGVLTVSTARNQALGMRSGDLLLIGTDGLTDAQNQDDTFGHDRLLRLVDELAERPARAIVEGLFAAIDRFQNGHFQDDDQTVVVIKGEAR
jgi:sigma-B regulation protein RsbU (phosphoserine phosphatase)